MLFHRLASLSFLLSRSRSRRSVLGAGVGLSGGILSRLAVTGGAAEEATPRPETEGPAFLFVQTALSGTFTPNPAAGTPTVDGTPVPGGGASFLLTLEGHHGETIYFSDRPERIVGEAPTPQFLAGLGFSPANPPNAALVAETAAGEDVIVLELITPAFVAETGTLTYGAEILAEYEGEGLAAVAQRQQDAELPEEFGHATLFIDDCADVTRCRIFLNKYAGPIPGGPYGMCWHWSSLTCEPCSTTVDQLSALCAQAYPGQCDGQYPCLPD